MVSCEGGDSVVVALDCESPLWVPRQSPGLRWGGRGSLPGVAFGELRGKSWSFYFSCHNRLWTMGKEKGLSHFHPWKVPVSWSTSGGRSWRTQGTESPHPSLSKVPSSKSWRVSVLPALLSVLACFPSSLPWDWDLSHHHTTCDLLEVRRTGAAKVAGPVFPHQSIQKWTVYPRTARSWYITGYLAQGKFCSLFCFSQIRFLSKNTRISVSSKIPLKEIGHLHACFRCESRWLHFA